MQHVEAGAKIRLILVGFLLVAATSQGVARFAAPAPSEGLIPLDGAASIVEILQGNRAILWTAMGAPVSSVVVRGWPVASGDTELGGALMMERPQDGSAGVIELGEAPMSVTFDTG